MKTRGPYLLAAAALLLVVAALLGRALTSRSLTRLPSSFSAGPEGILALRRLLAELEIPVQTRMRPWDDLAGARPAGVLVVALPLQRPVDPPEADVLLDWVRRGGAVLVVDDATGAERDRAVDRILAEAGMEPSPPTPEMDELTLMPQRPKTEAASGAPVSPAGEDLGGLHLHAEGGILPGLTGFPLALDPDGVPVAAETAVGSGRVVLVCGPLLANDRLLEGDNLKFALRLIADLRGGGAVAFDEYHHGFGGALPAIRGLDRKALLWAAAQASFALLLYGLARGARFGPPRIVPEPARRSSLEFVCSLASLYRRAGARRHVLEEALARFERETRGRFGLPAGLGLEALAGAVAGRARLETGRVLGPLRAAEAALRHPRVAEREMIERARDLARLEEEVLGGDREAA